MNNKEFFSYLKFKELIFLVLIVIATRLVIISIGITSGKSTFIFNLFLYGVVLIWIMIKCNNFEIKYRKIIGGVPKKFGWLKIIILGISLSFLSAGMFWLLLYIGSFISPSLVKKIIKVNTSNFLLQNKYILFLLNRGIVIIIVPIVEEFVFRGMLLHKLKVKWGIKRAILISSMIFAIFHLNFIGGFIFSIILSILYIKDENLIIPIILHIINNSIMTLSLFFTKNNINVKQALSLSWSEILAYSLSFLVVIYYMRDEFDRKLRRIIL